MRFRSIIQFLSLAAFLFLMVIAVTAGLDLASSDIYLRMDPLIVFGSAISGRVFLLAFIPAVIVVLVTMFFGRIFCGYICPMGITIDCSDKIQSIKKKKGEGSPFLYKLKYFLLFFILG